MSVSARATAPDLHGAPVGDGADGDGNACEQARPPPSPAAPLRMDANNPPEVSLRCLLPFLHLLEQAHGTDAIDAIVERAGRVVGISDISYSALRRSSPDDVWVSIAFLDALRDSMFADIYGMNGLPPRTDPLWQLWRQAGVFGFQKEMLGSVLFPILKGDASTALGGGAVSRAAHLASTASGEGAVSRAAHLASTASGEGAVSSAFGLKLKAMNRLSGS